MRNNYKGFLLLEIMVSIVIITTGCLFVMRGFSSSKNSIQRSSEIFKTSLLLEKVMWRLEEKGEIEEGLKTGDFREEDEYAWRIYAERLEDSDLNLVTLEVFQKGDPENTKYYASTYLKNKIE